MKRSGTTLLIFLIAAAVIGACDDDPSPKQEDVTPFLGTWSVTTGGVNLNCGGTPLPVMQSLVGTVEIAMATMAPLQATFSDPTLAGCALYMDVADGIAQVRGGNTCSIFHPFFNGTITVNNGTMELNDGGATITATGVVEGAITGGLPLQGCAGSFTTQLGRAVPDAGILDTGHD